jgi:hypothetical protein
MGHGHTPSPWSGPGRPTYIDEGTSARIGSPTPEPIGFDSKPAGAKGGSKKGASMADQIVAYARQRLGDRVGNGECFTLVDRALRNAGARSAADYGEITPDADYVWGTAVNLSELRPGDVIQFREYEYTRTVVTSTDQGESSETEEGGRPHHTAIVESVDGSAVTVLEQNAPDGAPVTRKRLYFADSTTEVGDTTTTVDVSGTWWFYRPQP